MEALLFQCHVATKPTLERLMRLIHSKVQQLLSNYLKKGLLPLCCEFVMKVFCQLPETGKQLVYKLTSSWEMVPPRINRRMSLVSLC